MRPEGQVLAQETYEKSQPNKWSSTNSNPVQDCVGCLFPGEIFPPFRLWVFDFSIKSTVFL